MNMLFYYTTGQVGKMMRKVFHIMVFPMLCMGPLHAQDADSVTSEKKQDKGFARDAFESAQLMDIQSVMVNSPKTLEFTIQHRFGTVNNGIEDLYGLYASSNIRLGLSYSPIKNLSIGAGITKFKNYVDLNLKYALLRQRKDWSIPVSVTYFANTAIKTQNPGYFPETVHRFSYFHELIIASRISPKISLQVSPSFGHFNAVDTLFSNDMVSLGVGGRYKISDQSSIVFNYVHPFMEHKDPTFALKPNITIGFEVSTGSHAFQVFISNFQGIIPQENMAYNQNDFTKGNFLIGFNITRLWNF